MDISNKTLSLFVLAALIVSLVSVTVTLNKVTQVRSLTGFASTGAGNVSVQILQATDITVLNSTIDFGSGVVNSTNSYCENATLHTNNTGLNTDNCWINSTESMAGLGYAAPVRLNATGIVIRNDGNKNLTITMDSNDNDAATFLGSTDPDPEYNYTVQNEEATSCPEEYMHTNTWHGINDNTSMEICSDLKWQDSADTINITFRIVFSANATGFKNDTLTFTGAISSAT